MSTLDIFEVSPHRIQRIMELGSEDYGNLMSRWYHVGRFETHEDRQLCGWIGDGGSIAGFIKEFQPDDPARDHMSRLKKRRRLIIRDALLFCGIADDADSFRVAVERGLLPEGF